MTATIKYNTQSEYEPLYNDIKSLVIDFITKDFNDGFQPPKNGKGLSWFHEMVVFLGT